MGWKGINIDGFSSRVMKFMVERPGEINLNVAIGE
jgi:hypothetical protein